MVIIWQNQNCKAVTMATGQSLSAKLETLSQRAKHTQGTAGSVIRRTYWKPKMLRGPHELRENQRRRCRFQKCSPLFSMEMEGSRINR